MNHKAKDFPFESTSICTDGITHRCIRRATTFRISMECSKTCDLECLQRNAINFQREV